MAAVILRHARERHARERSHSREQPEASSKTGDILTQKELKQLVARARRPSLVSGALELVRSGSGSIVPPEAPALSSPARPTPDVINAGAEEERPAINVKAVSGTPGSASTVEAEVLDILNAGAAEELQRPTPATRSTEASHTESVEVLMPVPAADAVNVGAEQMHTSAEALEGLFIHLVQEEHHVLEEAARTIQKIYRGKIARRQMHARLHALEHEVEEAIEEGVKEVFTFVMGSKYITKNTKRPEKLPVRHICKELVQARLWRGWVLFLIVFVCAAPQKHSPPPPPPRHAC